jgi:23S rRNA (uracil1939-C5)-methyltransferase
MATMDIRVEKLVYGGDGLAHHNGATIFVPYVLPAEQVVVAPTEKKKKFVRAQIERLVEPSPDRTKPRCPHFGVCGGCHYQHAPYEAQLRYKAGILRETLRRIGRVDWTGEISIHASPPWGYRNRAQWKVRPLERAPAARELRGASKTRLGIGYFRANSTALCAPEDCAILSPKLLETLLALRGALASGALPEGMREIEAFSPPSASSDESKLLLTVTFADLRGRVADVAQAIRASVPGIESLVLYEPRRERMELYGPGFVQCDFGSNALRVGHFSFFQVNNFLIEELVREVVEREEPGRLALDLFAGVGLFSVPLARRFERIVAVESNPAAARDLEVNTRVSSAIGVHGTDVEHFLEKFQEKPDTVVLDPPRTGLTRGPIARLAALSPPRITYVSCEPPTLARDLMFFREAGYEPSEVHLFDLFPQTFHIETVVRLYRHP